MCFSITGRVGECRPTELMLAMVPWLLTKTSIDRRHSHRTVLLATAWTQGSTIHEGWLFDRKGAAWETDQSIACLDGYNRETYAILPGKY